jgi:hypothetical protein
MRILLSLGRILNNTHLSIVHSVGPLSQNKRKYRALLLHATLKLRQVLPGSGDGGVRMVECLQLALVFLVIARWSKDLFIIFMTFRVVCTEWLLIDQWNFRKKNRESYYWATSWLIRKPTTNRKFISQIVESLSNFLLPLLCYFIFQKRVEIYILQS